MRLLGIQTVLVAGPYPVRGKDICVTGRCARFVRAPERCIRLRAMQCAGSSRGSRRAGSTFVALCSCILLFPRSNVALHPTGAFRIAGFARIL